eukprot:jgi/Bigna1/70168/fgenesh1_pg.11_\
MKSRGGCVFDAQDYSLSTERKKFWKKHMWTNTRRVGAPRRSLSPNNAAIVTTATALLVVIFYAASINPQRLGTARIAAGNRMRSGHTTFGKAPPHIRMQHQLQRVCPPSQREYPSGTREILTPRGTKVFMENDEQFFGGELRGMKNTKRNTTLKMEQVILGDPKWDWENLERTESTQDDIIEPICGEAALEMARNEKDLWIFAYGSEMWEPSFPIAEKRDGWVKGFVRRFYARSEGRWGTKEKPGRKLTMMREHGAWIWGHLLRVPEDSREAAMQAIADLAEEGETPKMHWYGFAKSSREGGGIFEGRALSYVMDEDHSLYSKLSNNTDLARDIVTAVGDSGSGASYLVSLYNTLGEIKGFDRTLGFQLDHHVDDIVEALPETSRVGEAAWGKGTEKLNKGGSRQTYNF